MPAATPNELQPLSEAEKTRCIEAGTAFFGLHVWQGAELHVVHPPTSRAKGTDALLILLSGIFLAALVCLLSLSESVYFWILVQLLGLFFTWNVFAKGRSSWTLRMQPKGFVYARSGRWYPYHHQLRRGSRDEVSAIQRPSQTFWSLAAFREFVVSRLFIMASPGDCLRSVQLGRCVLYLPAQTHPQAEQLEAIWSQHLGGTVADALPPDARAPAGMGQLYVSVRRPHGARVYAGQARLAPDILLPLALK